MANNKRDEKVKQLRVLQIDYMIRNGDYPSVHLMMEKFEASRSTIMRDLVFLQDRYKAPLMYDRKRRGYYYTDSTFFLKCTMLSESELFTITTIIPLLEQYKNTPLEASFKNILSRIVDLLPEQIKVDSSFNINGLTFIADSLPKIDETTFNRVFDSIKLKKTLEFGYRSISKNEYTVRQFDPYNVVCQKGNWYVIGYCHKHSRINVYAFSRMADVNITDKEFIVQDSFDIKNHIDLEVGVWTNCGMDKEKIELLFSPKISTYILERNWHIDQECVQNEDGSVYLSFESNQLQEILFWVLRFGSSVEVLNPPSLRERVIEEAKLMCEKYAISH
jgi:proteasome accessory factor B